MVVGGGANCSCSGSAGGSGGGGGGNTPGPKLLLVEAGNTPPVSPSQGKDGGEWYYTT